jgi:hypothetical protein
MAPSKQFMNSTYRADLLESRQTLPDRVNMIQFKGNFINYTSLAVLHDLQLDYSSDYCMPPVKDQLEIAYNCIHSNLFLRQLTMYKLFNVEFRSSAQAVGRSLPSLH